MIYLMKYVPGMFGLMLRLADKTQGTLSSVIVIASFLLCAVIAYLLGSLNTSIIVSKLKFNDDIRRHGSGNAGLTNMMRVYGKSGAGLTLLGDVLKQVVAVFVGILLVGHTGAYLAGLFCMLGHIFPVFYKFKGGKGVLTAATMILVIDPMICLVLLVVFALVLVFTKYVSLSSVMAAFTYPAAVYYASKLRTGNSPDMWVMFFALFVGALVIYMHRKNIHRLFNNQEPKFSFRKKPEAQEILDMEDKENDGDDSYCPEATSKSKKRKK